DTFLVLASGSAFLCGRRVGLPAARRAEEQRQHQRCPAAAPALHRARPRDMNDGSRRSVGMSSFFLTACARGTRSTRLGGRALSRTDGCGSGSTLGSVAVEVTLGAAPRRALAEGAGLGGGLGGGVRSARGPLPASSSQVESTRADVAAAKSAARRTGCAGC